MATLVHIDTCLSCYLLDHHDREGELLLGVPVDGKTRTGEVFDGLVDSFKAVAGEDVEVTDREFLEALDECFAGVDKRKTFDKSLDVSTSDNELEDVCQAWFLLTWNSDDEPDSTA